MKKPIALWGEGNRGKLKLAASMLFLVLALCLVMHYMFAVLPMNMHSDDTDTIMWAQATYDSGKLLNPDFCYACFLPFGGQLLMLPFFPVFGFSMRTHLCGMVLFLGLWALSMVFLFRSFRWSYGKSFFATGVMLLFPLCSKMVRDVFYGHIIYYSLGLLFLFVAMGLALRYLDEDTKNADGSEKPLTRRDWILAALLFVWFLLCSTDGIMSIVIFAAPCIGAFFLERLLDREAPRVFDRRMVLLLLAMVLGFAAGFGVSKVLTAQMHSDYAETLSAFNAKGGWLDSLFKLFPHWFSMLGVDIPTGTSMLSPAGVLYLVRIFMALVLAAVPLLSLFVYRKLPRFGRIMILAHFILTLLIALGYTFGMLWNNEWRLCPLILTALLCCIVLVDYGFRSSDLSAKRVATLGVVLGLAACALYGGTVLSLPNRRNQETGFHRLAVFLEDNGLTYGYGGFWQSNSITLAAKNDVKIRCVTFDNGDPEPFWYQTCKSWYTDQPGQETYFLLLTTEQYDQALAEPYPVLEKSTGTLTFEDYVILLFDENLF